MRAWLLHAKSGDHTTITQIYEMYGQSLYRLGILSRVGDPKYHECCRHQNVVAILEGLHTYEDRGWPFSAWLFRIARDRIMGIRRRERRRPVVVLDSAPSPPAYRRRSRDPRAARRSQHTDRTPDPRPADRNPHALSGQQQMPIEAVARYLDRSPAAVKALQARGIQTLGILIGTGGSRWSAAIRWVGWQYAQRCRQPTAIVVTAATGNTLYAKLYWWPTAPAPLRCPAQRKAAESRPSRLCECSFVIC